MANYLNNNQKTPSLFEEAMLGRMYDEPKDDGNNKPRTNVVINTNRLWYGEDSTVSAFIATAYDEQGNTVDAMGGYFLEPGTDYALAKSEGKKKAIMSGQYNVIPKKEMIKKENEKREKNKEPKIERLKYEWYIDTPPGRSFVAIHKGNRWNDTTGCLLPGDTYSYDESTDTYKVSTSTQKTNKLFDFFNQYGENGIKINIGPHFEDLYK